MATLICDRCNQSFHISQASLDWKPPEYPLCLACFKAGEELIRQVWEIVDRVDKVKVSLALAKLDGSFEFVVYSDKDLEYLRENLPPEGKYIIWVNWSREELERLAKNKISTDGKRKD